jgi:hypothetical protein
MKKILLILLILTFMFPLSGEKKMDIIHSVWLISHPVFEDVSCINPETGELNEPRAEYFVQIAENCGATGMRFLPGLLIDYKIFPGAKLKGYNYLPWEWTGEGFDLSRQNPIYFENLKRLAAILKKHGLMLVFSLYDRCHWDNGRSKIPGVSGEMGLIPHSPWLFNINNIKSMYQRTRFHDAYENSVLEVLMASGCKFKIEFVNEPRVDSKTYISFTLPIMEKCKKAGIKQNQLIGGLEWFINGERNGQYDTWRMKTNFTDSFEGGKADEQVGCAVVHCFTSHNLTIHHLYEAQNHTRRFFMSTDGIIITRQALKENLSKYFALANNKKRVLTWCFEWLYQGNGTELYGSMGISEAINRHFGFYPGKTPLIDPNLKDPGNPPQKTEPDQLTPPNPGPPEPINPAPPAPDPSNSNAWYIVLGAAIAAAAVFCFIKFPVITVLVLAVLLLAAAYTGYKKKWKYYYVYLTAAYALILAAGLLTDSPALNKALFGGAMGVIAVLSLIVDNFYKKIKELKKRR